MILIQNRLAIGADDIKKASPVCEYNIGAEIAAAVDGVAQPTVYKYVKASAKLTQYAPCVLVQAAGGIVTAAPATATAGVIIGIPQVEIPADCYGFVAIEGPCTAAAGSGIAAGDTLEVIDGGTTLTIDGTTGSPKETANTVAVAVEAPQGGNAPVVLLGKRVTIAAS